MTTSPITTRQQQRTSHITTDGLSFRHRNTAKTRLKAKLPLHPGQITTDPSNLSPSEINQLLAQGYTPGPAGYFFPPWTKERDYNDIDLRNVVITAGLRDQLSVSVREAITDATVERTIEGASVVTISIEDKHRTFVDAGYAVAQLHSRVTIDDLNFTLVGVVKRANNYTLTFEDTTVNQLRRMKGYKRANRANITRAEFIKSLIDECNNAFRIVGTGEQIRFWCPELAVSEPIASPTARKSKKSRQAARQHGFPPGVSFTVKGNNASRSQVDIAQRVLDQGVAMKMPKKVLVASIMTIIQESDISILTSMAQGGFGPFSQLKNGAWPASGIPEVDAAAFFRQAIQVYNGNPSISENDLAQTVQRSGFPLAYGQWKKEAENIVNLYGQGDPFTASRTTQKTNDPYYFERKQGEDSWTCIQRLASEVQWRAFCSQNVLFFLEEQQLIRSSPVMAISENDDAVDWIDYDYDEQQSFTSLVVTCRAYFWEASPGTCIEIIDDGPTKGTWIVYDVQRNMFKRETQITIHAPTLPLPEPAPTQSSLTGAGRLGAVTNTQGYVIPIPSSMTLGRTDMGVDFGGKGFIKAVGNAVITWLHQPGGGSGWPGANGPGTGGGIVYQLLDGDHKNAYIYLCEDITFPTNLKTHMRIAAGQIIAEAWGGPTGIETGFASGPIGASPLTPYNGMPDGTPMPGGIQFGNFLKALGYSYRTIRG